MVNIKLSEKRLRNNKITNAVLGKNKSMKQNNAVMEGIKLLQEGIDMGGLISKNREEWHTR